jgi:hypothetical protein
MAAYATVPPDDPFAVSKAMFAALAGGRCRRMGLVAESR